MWSSLQCGNGTLEGARLSQPRQAITSLHVCTTCKLARNILCFPTLGILIILEEDNHETTYFFACISHNIEM